MSQRKGLVFSVFISAGQCRFALVELTLKLTFKLTLKLKLILTLTLKLTLKLILHIILVFNNNDLLIMHGTNNITS